MHVLREGKFHPLITCFIEGFPFLSFYAFEILLHEALEIVKVIFSLQGFLQKMNLLYNYIY